MKMILGFLLFATALGPGRAWADRVGKLEPLKVKFMLRGYCLAGSRVDPKALGGFGGSENWPQEATYTHKGVQGRLTLLALPERFVPFAEKYDGFRLLLINRTGKETAFQASDSLLSIVQEAKDPMGKWRPVEYIPSSWCGNSYHRVFLPNDRYWEFAAPRYSGPYRTKLRFVLKGEPDLVSNEFEGSVDPAQFSH
jgi:hypothetical protein